MNIYPYNYIILLIAFIVLIVYIVITLSKLNKLSKEINNVVDTCTNSANKLTKELTTYEQSINSKIEFATNAAKGISAYVLVKAILNDYKKSSNKGIKQLQSSATSVIKTKQLNAMIRQAASKAIR